MKLRILTIKNELPCLHLHRFNAMFNCKTPDFFRVYFRLQPGYYFNRNGLYDHSFEVATEQ